MGTKERREAGKRQCGGERKRKKRGEEEKNVWRFLLAEETGARENRRRVFVLPLPSLLLEFWESELLSHFLCRSRRGGAPSMSSALQFFYIFFSLQREERNSHLQKNFQEKKKKKIRRSSATRPTSPSRTAPSPPSRAPPSPGSLASRSSRPRPRAGKGSRRRFPRWRGRWFRG